MFKFIYWSAILISGVWAFAGVGVLLDPSSKTDSNSWGLNLFLILMTVSPLILLIIKRVWLKDKWNSTFGSLKNSFSGISEKRTLSKDNENIEKAFYSVQILTYVGISDNDLTSSDQVIIANFIKEIFSEYQAIKALEMLDQWGSTSKLAELDVNETLSKINKLCSREERRKIVEACKSLIKSDGKINQTESSIFGLIRKAIYPTGLSGAFSTKCSNCKSDQCGITSEKEVDRWLGRKEVTERLASGKVRTKNVSVTKIKMRYEWLCKDCYSQWLTTDVLEKV